MKKLTFMIVLIVFVLTSTFASTASAHSYYWHQDATYYVGGSMSMSGPILSGLYQWNQSFNNISSNIDLISSASNTDITFYESDYGSTGWGGTCTTSSVGDSIVGASITFNTYYTDDNSYTKNQAIATHEIGHAIGLAHSSSYEYSIMTYSTAIYWTRDGIYKPTSQDEYYLNINY